MKLTRKLATASHGWVQRCARLHSFGQGLMLPAISTLLLRQSINQSSHLLLCVGLHDRLLRPKGSGGTDCRPWVAGVHRSNTLDLGCRLGNAGHGDDGPSSLKVAVLALTNSGSRVGRGCGIVTVVPEQRPLASRRHHHQALPLTSSCITPLHYLQQRDAGPFRLPHERHQPPVSPTVAGFEAVHLHTPRTQVRLQDGAQGGLIHVVRDGAAVLQLPLALQAQ